MRLAVVVHLTGVLVRLFGPMLLLPALVAAYYREFGDAAGFALTGTGTIVLGHLMRLAGGAEGERAAERLRRVEGMTIVAGSWMLMAHLAAIPYVWAGLGFIDALFESMSGLTTTGATVFRDFSRFGRGIFFWRSLTHWVGGMGVIALFVAVLPRLAIGGRELFFAEASGPTDEKLTPQLRQTALALWQLYAALTAAEVVALWLAGMSPFDARLPFDGDARGGRFLAASSVDRRLPQRRRSSGSSSCSCSWQGPISRCSSAYSCAATAPH